MARKTTTFIAFLRFSALRLGALITALSVSACAPAPGAPAAVTPIVRQIGAAEAMQIVYDATATAGVVATQVAQTSATERAAAVVATARHRQTQDTLAMRATEQQLALLAGQATQGAVQTLDRHTQAAHQTALWAAPTLGALQTQAVVQAARQGQEQASRESAAEFWRWLRWLTLGLLGIGGLCWVVVAVVRAVALVRVETLRQKAAIAREAFRLMPGHWAEWQADDGYQVYPLPGLIEAPAFEDATPRPDRAAGWKHAYRLFAWWGDRYGFGIRDLGPEGAGVVSDPDWRRLVKPFREQGVLAEGQILREGRKVRVTTWASNWDYARVSDELSSGHLALPCPAGEEPPRVAFTVPTQHHAHHTTTRQHAEAG